MHMEVIYQIGASEEVVDSPPLMVHSSSPIKTGSVLPYRCVVGGEASVTNLCRGAVLSFVLPVLVGQIFNLCGSVMCGIKNSEIKSLFNNSTQSLSRRRIYKK